MKIKPGQYGFLKKQKMMYVVKMAVCVVAGLSIFLIGLWVNKGNYKNIGSVIAMLSVLPFAKSLTELVVVFPFRDVAKERYEKIAALCGEDAKLMASLVITSDKKVMFLDFAVVWEGNVIVLAGKRETDIPYISEYLTKGVRNWGFDYRVRIVKEEKAFIHAIEDRKPVQVSEEERKHVICYLESLIVK
ncbi:hypothetical protein [[Clostridium] polysaccharolyticum]|uniref:Uncharacterized protein n=1 Tax=[Clostridium] polysaccharolyticum TaxID=29364 RepID=A0A1I0AXG9_9FIRM|nr:hypothetical protein [[Clostridium] polysaccharolyticum]SES99076.1 hypothetical protein SAMN04487772_10680 [[Clostridium] polysaccharolyticum]